MDFAAGKYLNSGTAPSEALVQTAEWVVSFVVITVLFAFVFKVLPAVPLQWGDVAMGAIGTSLLFVARKLFLGAEFTRAYASRFGSQITERL